MHRMLNPMRARFARLLLAVAILAVPAFAVAPLGADHLPTDTLRVTVMNNSNQLLSPPVIIAAPHEWRPFVRGEAASADVEALAEMGNGQPLVDRAIADGAYVAMLSEAPLEPGEVRSYEIDAPVFEVDLWVMAMAVWTNDGFFVAHSTGVPGALSSLILQAHFLDAGTEVNDENCDNVPGCGGNGGGGEGGVVSAHPGLRFDGDIGEMYGIESGLWATWQRASIRVNPGPTPQTVNYELTIANHTSDQLFSGAAFGVHPTAVDVVPEGTPSTPGLTNLAENGDPSMLAQEWMDAGIHVVGTTSAPIAPGESMTIEFTGPQNGYVFWCAMLVSTNDGFTCGESLLPKKLESTGGMSGAYDNGTEANTYAASDVPGLGGSGHVDEDNIVRHHPDFPGYAGMFWTTWDHDGQTPPPAEEES